MNAPDPIVITGLGPVTGVGIGADDFLDGWREQRPGIRHITRFDTSEYSVRIGGEIDLDPGPWLTEREVKKLDRSAVLGIIAADLALESAGLHEGLPDAEGTGVFLGCGVGGGDAWLAGGVSVAAGRGHRIGPRIAPNGMANTAAAQVSIRYGARGPSLSSGSACSSGSDALISAIQSLRAGEVDIAIAGGCDAPINPIVLGSFCSLHALSTRNDDPATACRPFDADRDGFVLAEGAAALVIETLSHAVSRGATPLAVLAGYGRSSDAHHITQPTTDGAGARRAIQRALHNAGLGPEDIDFVHAHGTGTALNDSSESAAIGAIWPDGVPVVSMKGQLGHTLGASGPLAVIAAVQSLRTGDVPGTANFTRADDDSRLRVLEPGIHRLPVSAAAVNTNAFGGENTSLIITSTSHL